MLCVASTLNNTSEHGLSSINIADADTTTTSSRLNSKRTVSCTVISDPPFRPNIGN